MHSTGERDESEALSPPPETAIGMAALLVCAALLAAAVVAFISFPTAAWRASPAGALLGAARWLTETAVGGLSGLWLVWLLWVTLGNRAVRPSVQLAFNAVAGLVLIPPLLLLGERQSVWALALTAGLAWTLALCFRELSPAPVAAGPARPPGPFAELPPPDSHRGQAFLVAVCLEGTVVFLGRHQRLPALALLAAGCFLLVCRIVSGRSEFGRKRSRAAARAGFSALLAMMMVMTVLLERRGGGGGDGADGNARAAASPENKPGYHGRDNGFEGIILFTVSPKQKQVVLPIEHRDLVHAVSAKPIVILFNGAYWYFQALRHGLGPHPHLAHGDPVAVSIFSTNWMPLAMQAHQGLVKPVELACCREIEMTLANGDNRRGRIDAGVLLTDSSSPGKPSLYLGTKPIVSTEPDHFAFKASPVDEELSYAIPAHAELRQFTDITVFFFPSEERSTLGARVGIRQFELTPR